MLDIFSSLPFYTENVCLPWVGDAIPEEINENPKFFSFFQHAISAMDGTHFNCTLTAAEHQTAWDQKGCVTQNCLAACTFDLKFIYIYSGWEGLAADSMMYNNVRLGDLYIPPGKYLLADTGFPMCGELLAPYRGVHYHLAEWGQVHLR